MGLCPGAGGVGGQRGVRHWWVWGPRTWDALCVIGRQTPRLPQLLGSRGALWSDGPARRAGYGPPQQGSLLALSGCRGHWSLALGAPTGPCRLTTAYLSRPCRRLPPRRLGALGSSRATLSLLVCRFDRGW